jgi:hypothetical protein
MAKDRRHLIDHNGWYLLPAIFSIRCLTVYIRLTCQTSYIKLVRTAHLFSLVKLSSSPFAPATMHPYFRELVA